MRLRNSSAASHSYPLGSQADTPARRAYPDAEGSKGLARHPQGNISKHMERASGQTSDSATTVDAGRPVVGWRYWYVFSEEPPTLRSVSHPRFLWEAGRPLRATCAFRHLAPDPHCNCGVYGARDLETLRERGLCLRPGILVAGEVSLWGRLCGLDKDYRAEHAYPKTLYVVTESVPRGQFESVATGLRAYGVPVGSISGDEAVGELSRAFIEFQAMSARSSDRSGAS